MLALVALSEICPQGDEKWEAGKGRQEREGKIGKLLQRQDDFVSKLASKLVIIDSPLSLEIWNQFQLLWSLLKQ